jgi:hypothetical protein
MKLFSFFAAASIVASTLAQSIVIGAPVEGANITAGSPTVIEVDRPVKPIMSCASALLLTISLTGLTDGF